MERSESEGRPGFLLRKVLPVFSRVFVWGVILSIFFILRSFFLLIFLTFVFAYIQSHAVDKFERTVPPRTLRVVLVGLLFLAVLVGIGFFLTPQIRSQAELFGAKYTTYLYGFDREVVKLANSYPVLQDIVPTVPDPAALYSQSAPPPGWDVAHSPTALLLRQLLAVSEGESNPDKLRDTMHALKNVGGKLLSVGSAFFLSLLFSFLIVLDLPKLSKSVRGLADTKLGFMYHEVADSVSAFAGFIGSALEAQFYIALVNTALTGIGIYSMGLGENAAFLCVVVFLCSFIPVAGVFISSFPICLLALQAGGVHLMLFGIALILFIHFVETYFLNPKIYGHQLHINPVLVLIILTISGKLFSVWGLVLGLPICTYFFGHAIRYGESQSSSTDP